jgi:DNA-binding HxlR family transcriptional regulator
MPAPRSDSEGDFGEDECNVIDSLSELGSEWRLVVLYDLQKGEKRFNQLKRSTGASGRTLSRVLDDLQEMGYVSRRLEEDTPVAAFYSLTPKGQSLCPVFDEIEDWTKEWADQPASDSDSG